MTSIWAKRQFLTVGLIICGLMSLAACGGGAGSSNGSGHGASGGSNGGGSGVTLTSADAILSAAKGHTPKDATYTLVYTSKDTATNGGADVNTTLNGTGELTSNPARSHVTFSGTINNNTTTIETIADGTTLYTKSMLTGIPSDGMWHKTTVSGSSNLSVGSLSDIYTQLKDPKLVGTETVNGVNAYHITATPVGDPSVTDPSSTTATEDLWIRTDNYYLLKQTGNSSTKDADSGDPITATSNLTFTKWDSGITIDLPPADQVAAGA